MCTCKLRSTVPVRITKLGRAGTPASPNSAQLLSRGDCPLGWHPTWPRLGSFAVSKRACWNLLQMSLATVSFASRPVWNENRDVVIPVTRGEDAGEYDRY